jgi:hypothetical protein
MLGHKGTTLIEALLAFSIYCVVIVMFMSLMRTLNTSALDLKKREQTLNYDESTLFMSGGDEKSLIEKVLP